MAITTDSTYTVSSGGISYDIIGFSKTLNNYTTDEILAYTYCSSDNTLMKHIQKREQIAYFTMVENTGVAVPWNMAKVSGNVISINAGDPAMENYGQDGVYCGIIWLARTSNGNDMYITSSNWSNYKIITSFKAKNYCYELSSPSIVANNYGQSGWNGTQQTAGFPIWYLGGGSLYYYIDANGTNKISLSSQNIRPYAMFKHDGKVFFVQFSDSSSITKYDALNTLNTNTSDPNYYPYIASNGIGSFDGTGYAIAAAALENYPLSSPFPKNYNQNSLGQYGSSFVHFAADEGICLLGQFGGTIHNPPLYYAGSETFIYFNSKDSVLDFWKGIGIKFKGDKVYKPIIVDGYVSGYSDDLTVKSDLDNYIGDTQHTVPGTRPSGGDGDDDDPSDDQSSGGIYGGAQGMCNLYYMTAGEIKNLQNWFRGTVFAPGIQIPANFDPSNQLIALMAFPIELGGSVDSTTITFRTADNQSVDTGVSCQKAYGDDLKFDMGTINIPARMQERGVPFLDYSSQIEVYIPFCDVVQLDVQQVIGTTLKCEMWINPATGDVSAMLSSGTHPVAYTSGSCAQQLPISVSSYGAIAGARLAADHKMTQAVFQSAQNIVKDITNAGAITSAVSNHTAVNGQGLVEFSRIPQVQSNTGLAVGAGIKAGGDVVNTALALTAQNLDNKYALQVAKNSAPTHVSGSFGACTSWHFPNYCYVKITRPHFQKPDNYGHTEAVPVVATKQLSSLTGLTTCVNPDVSGIGTATMNELETIKSYLMSGVIL